MTGNPYFKETRRNIMKNTTLLIIGFILLSVQTATTGSEYNSINSTVFLKILQEKQAVHVVDIQKKNNYLQKHFAHSLATNAYPVKTAEEKNRIKAVLATLQATDNSIVIVGPRGTRASQKAYAYLLEQDIDPRRLAILEKGIRGWPAPQLLLNTSGQ
jgi:rhodanese-related sulfurtransferase